MIIYTWALSEVGFLDDFDGGRMGLGWREMGVGWMDGDEGIHISDEFFA